MNKIFTQVQNKPDLDRQMSYRWLRQLTRRDLKPFASNQEDRNVNIDPWESPPAQAKSCANATLVYTGVWQRAPAPVDVPSVFW